MVSGRPMNQSAAFAHPSLPGRVPHPLAHRARVLAARIGQARIVIRRRQQHPPTVVTLCGEIASFRMSRIAIVGTGYVGLTTGACFAHLGHEVACADVDADKVAQLSRGEVPIVEHGLDRLVEEGLRSGRLRFVVGAANAVRDSEVAFLCVPTPQGEDGSADLSYIEAAAREISEHLPYEGVVVNKSTVPVGSTRVVERVLDRPDVRVVSNPEFLREGSAVQDFLKPDRIVVGSTDQAAAIKVASLYLGVPAPVIVTDPVSAETIKYAANAFLATKLSFVNAVAAICEGVGADVDDVVLGLGYDKRIGQDFLRPGPGWGGSCFPKDTRALLKIADDAGYEFDLLDGVVAVNDEQFDRVAEKVRSAVGGDLDGKTVAVWGLTFKARTDDLRESPSLAVIERLAAERGHHQGARPHREWAQARPAGRDHDLRRPRRGVRGRRRPGHPHRMGRLPVDRRRQGGRGDEAATPSSTRATCSIAASGAAPGSSTRASAAEGRPQHLGAERLRALLGADNPEIRDSAAQTRACARLRRWLASSSRGVPVSSARTSVAPCSIVATRW